MVFALRTFRLYVWPFPNVCIYIAINTNLRCSDNNLGMGGRSKPTSGIYDDVQYGLVFVALDGKKARDFRLCLGDR